MAKNERGRGSTVSKPPGNDVPETESDIMRQLSMFDGSHSSMGPIKTIGESDLGPIRMSSYGTYNRVVLMAIDASPAAKYAFQCESVRFKLLFVRYYTFI